MDRQKKLFLFGGAWLSALLITLFVYRTTAAPREEKMVRVVVATRDMPVGTLLKSTDLKTVNYPEKDVPKGVVFRADDAVGRVLIAPLNMNEPVLNGAGKLTARTGVEGAASMIEPGYRAVSVSITDVSGVAGLVQPGSKVDVLFTRPGSMAEATTSTILQNVKVLSTGRLAPTGTTPDPKAPRSPVVTLVLTPDDAQKLELAKNQGKISLSLRNPLDASGGGSADPITTEVLDPMISARVARARRGRTTAIGRANLDDPKVWQDLTGEKKPVDSAKLALEEEARRKKAAADAEAQKPKVVIDVFRGDKHTQETFK
jgi:pilus assembly protein CpaB